MDARDVGLSGSPTSVGDLRPVEVRRERLLLSGSDPASIADSLLLALKARGLRGRGGKARALQKLPSQVSEPRPERSIWAVCELLPPQGTGQDPRLRDTSFELIGEAARIGAEVRGEAVAVLLGHGVRGHAGELAAHGASTVLLGDVPELAGYNSESYAWALARAIEQYRPWAVLLPATSFGSDLAPRVAARLGLGLTGDCLGFEIGSEGQLLQLKPAFGGQVVATITSHTLPNMATVRPGMLSQYAPVSGREPRVVQLDLADMPSPRARLLSATYEGEAGLALDRARLVVCAGSGIGSLEALDAVQQLADALGRWMGLPPESIAVGGTRKVVDAGWLPRTRQIGITGHAVSPDLYVALALKGNFNHVAGIMGSGTVLAVNSDPQADIFSACDIGVVANWQTVCEALVERIS